MILLSLGITNYTIATKTKSITFAYENAFIKKDICELMKTLSSFLLLQGLDFSLRVVFKVVANFTKILHL